MSTGWRDVVERFGMAAHPEGGWYVETWRADPPPGGTARPVASAILFLLPAGEESRWHRVDADELWQYSAGDPLELRIAAADGGPVAPIGSALTSREATWSRSWYRRGHGRRRVHSGRGRSWAASWLRLSRSMGSNWLRRAGNRPVDGPGIDDLTQIPRRGTHSG